MRKTWNVLLLIFAVTTACLLRANPAVDVSGSWAGEISSQDGGKGTVRLVLKQAGEQISGTAGPADKQTPPQIHDAKLQANHLTFVADDSDDSGLKLTYHFDLTVTGDQIHGKADGRSGDRSWTMDISLTREK
jgi:hypothetical protein